MRAEVTSVVTTENPPGTRNSARTHGVARRTGIGQWRPRGAHA